jgi:hypothetical protein
MSLQTYRMPEFGSNRVMMEDEDGWREDAMYARRHEGLYESRLERMQREWAEENSDEE